MEKAAQAAWVEIDLPFLQDLTMEVGKEGLRKIPQNSFDLILILVLVVEFSIIQTTLY